VKIAFATNRGGLSHSEIYVMNVDGTVQTDVSRNAAGYAGVPNWSPDGTKIAFAFRQDIYVMNADGTDQKNLTSSPAWDDSPAWSPDGKRIAFLAPVGPNSDIYVMNADGSGQTDLTPGPERDAFPDWQPLSPPQAQPPPPPLPPPPTRCRVPRVLGLLLSSAKVRIRHRHCSLGGVRRRHSRRVGRVIRQHPAPGVIRRRGYPIVLVVGRR